MSYERLKELALDHLGGSPETDDVAIFNRLTGATIATHLTLVKPGDVVVPTRLEPSGWVPSTRSTRWTDMRQRMIDEIDRIRARKE